MDYEKGILKISDQTASAVSFIALKKRNEWKPFHLSTFNFPYLTLY
jgi:hypothetical protein